MLVCVGVLNIGTCSGGGVLVYHCFCSSCPTRSLSASALLPALHCRFHARPPRRAFKPLSIGCHSGGATRPAIGHFARSRRPWRESLGWGGGTCLVAGFAGLAGWSVRPPAPHLHRTTSAVEWSGHWVVIPPCNTPLYKGNQSGLFSYIGGVYYR